MCHIYIVCREVYLNIQSPYLIQIHAVATVEKIGNGGGIGRFAEPDDMVKGRRVNCKIRSCMCYQQFACNGAISDCEGRSHCRFDYIDKLRYIVIAWLDIICIHWAGYESPAECVVYGGDRIK